MAQTSCACQTAPAACGFHVFQAGERHRERERERERESEGGCQY